MALTAVGLRTPSHSVVPSRFRSSIEYVSGSVFARKYAMSMLLRTGLLRRLYVTPCASEAEQLCAGERALAEAGEFVRPPCFVVQGLRPAHQHERADRRDRALLRPVSLGEAPRAQGDPKMLAVPIE